MIGRVQRDPRVDWSSIFLRAPPPCRPRCPEEWGLRYVLGMACTVQVCSQCLCTPCHAPATRSRRETVGGCETREKSQRRKSGGEQSYLYSSQGSVREQQSPRFTAFCPEEARDSLTFASRCRG